MWLEPFPPAEDEDGDDRDDDDDAGVQPEGIRAMRERDIDAHRHNVGISSHRKQDGRKDSEDLHCHIELVGKEGVVGLL